MKKKYQNYLWFLLVFLGLSLFSRMLTLFLFLPASIIFQE